VIERWGALKDVHDVRAFLGTVGIMRMFIQDFLLRAEPIQKLTKKDMEFVWGDKQEVSIQVLKDSLRDYLALRPLTYE
jgi:hypothetical protein